MGRKVKDKDLKVIRNMPLSVSILKEEHLDMDLVEELGEGTLDMLEIGGPTSTLQVVGGSTLIIPKIKNPILAILGVGLLTLSILRSRYPSLSLGIVGPKILIMLPIFWTTFYMRSGVVIDLDLIST